MIRRAIAVTLLAIAGADTPHAGRIEFDIPAGPAIDTLAAWHRQAHVSMLFDYQQLEHAGNTRAVRGEFDRFEALRLMTAGTRLQFDITSHDAIVIGVDRIGP